jgi:putative transposase
MVNDLRKYIKHLYHIVFRTKISKNTISEQHEKELYANIMGIVNNKMSKLNRIGGMPNKIHLLDDIHPTFALSDFTKEFIEYSSKWLSSNKQFYSSALYQNGFGLIYNYTWFYGLKQHIFSS